MGTRLLSLADGVVGELTLDATPSTLRRLGTSLAAELAPAERGLLLRLWHGLDPRHAMDPRLAPLLRRGLLAIRGRRDDPVLQRHLDDQCQPWGWCWPGPRAEWARLYRASLRAHARRKLLVQDYGQTPCLPETSVRRALQCPADARRVLCIGDDDLVSLPLALRGHRVLACDIDGVLLIPLLRQLARDGDLPLHAVQRDLACPWPVRERGVFDAVLTDPMSTRGCLRLFLSRAISALRVGGLVIGCVHQAALDAFDEVRRELCLELRAHHADFNRYLDENWSVDAYRSDLVVLARTRHSREAVAADQISGEDLFGEVQRYRAHAWCTLRALRPLAELTLRRAVQAVQGSGLLSVVSARSVDVDGELGWVATLAGGGSFTLRARPGHHELSFAVFPFTESRDAALLQVLLRALPGAVARYGHPVLRPHRQILRVAPAADGGAQRR